MSKRAKAETLFFLNLSGEKTYKAGFRLINKGKEVGYTKY